MTDGAIIRPRLSPAEEDGMVEKGLLTSLLVEHPAHLTIDDLYREHGQAREDFSRRDAVNRAVRNLVASGLAHRNGPFVIPSRAALHFERLEEQ